MKACTLIFILLTSFNLQAKSLFPISNIKTCKELKSAKESPLLFSRLYMDAQEDVQTLTKNLEELSTLEEECSRMEELSKFR